MTAPRFANRELLTSAKLNLLSDAVDAGGPTGVVVTAANTLSTMQGRLLVQPTVGSTGTDSPNINAIRVANHTGGSGGNVNALRAYTSVGAGVTNTEWTFLCHLDNSANAGENCAAYVTGRKKALGMTFSAVFESTDTVGLPSSAAGPLIGIEVDCTSSDLDDYDNGIRVGVDTVITKTAGASAAAEIGWGNRVSIQTGASVRRGFSMLNGTFNQAAFDSSLSTAGTRGGVAAAAFRSAKNQLWDFSGASTHTLKLNAAGDVLQYTANGATVVSLSSAGSLSLAGNIDPTGGVVLAANRKITFSGEGFHSLSYNGSGTLQYKPDGTTAKLSVDDAGAVVAASTVTAAGLSLPASGEISFNNAGTDRALRYTSAGGGLLQYRNGGTTLFNISDAGVVSSGSVFDAGAYRVSGTQVVGARHTGWTASTGTATRTAFATSTATTQDVAERLKALIDDLTTHGLIGT